MQWLNREQLKKYRNQQHKYNCTISFISIFITQTNYSLHDFFWFQLSSNQ